MHFTRRSFMGVTLAGVGSLALPQQAGAAGKQKLIVVFARGAWDPVWTIDPKDPSLPNIDSPNDGSIKKISKIDVRVAAARPNVEAFFVENASQCAVVRGINVGSIAHSSSHVRMMTGTRTELNPDIGSIMGVALGGGLALPYADIGGGAYPGAFAAQMGRLGKHNQVVTLLDRSKAFKPATKVDYVDTPLLVPKAGEAAKIRAFVEARADRAALVRGAKGDNMRRLADYRGGFQRAEDLRGIDELLTLPLSGAGDLASQIELALTMLKTSSCSVYLDSGQDWDTHTVVTDQGISANALFGDLSLLMKRLKETGLLANTTVVVMSEMGRTPKLNDVGPQAGKDHWPVTSAMVLGAGVKPGVYGATDDQLNARGIDLVSGAAKDGNLPLGYNNFAAGVLNLIGVNNKDWLPDDPLLGFMA